MSEKSGYTYLLVALGTALGAVAAALLVRHWSQIQTALPEDCPVCRVLGLTRSAVLDSEEQTRIVLADSAAGDR